MAVHEALMTIKNDKKLFGIIKLLGAAVLLLILLSFLLSDKDDAKNSDAVQQQEEALSLSDYCHTAETKLGNFLRNIEGVGEVKVYLTFRNNEEYVYATEGKTSISENKKEEEYKYVMTGGSSDKSALVETIISPQVSGAVIACTGCDSAAVQEKVYNAVSTALGIPTSRIYVTKLQ